MQHIQTVLCPVDGSEYADRALAHAAELCRGRGARLVVLTVRPVVPIPALWLSSAAMALEVDAQAMAQARAALADEVRRVTDYSRVELEVAVGDVVTEILRVAGERSADVLVVGTHGLRGATSWSADLIVLGAAGWNPPYGSTTARVLREAKCPVLVITPGHQPS